MSVHLRKEQCCTSKPNGVPCTRPARELGKLCTACWMALSPAAREFLRETDTWGTDEPRHLTTPQVGAIALLSYDPVAGAEAILRTG